MSMIAAFYGGKSILITGATGFLGKVLIEKLCRTSPDLKVIYILVRPKAGHTLQQRVSQIDPTLTVELEAISALVEPMEFRWRWVTSHRNTSSILPAAILSALSLEGPSSRKR